MELRVTRQHMEDLRRIYSCRDLIRSMDMRNSLMMGILLIILKNKWMTRHLIVDKTKIYK